MDPEIEDLIEELAFKYLLHLPSEEYENKVQLCYAFQLAHWEYLDAPETEHYSPKLSFSQFVVCMLDHAPGIGLNKENVPEIVRMFNKMNWQIPVFGAILINTAMDKVLLTQAFIAHNKGGVWMFPRGKVEKKDHGNSFDCACREVLEETGYDIRGKAYNDEAHYLERSIQAGNETKVVGLFLVPNVDEDFPFCSQTQGEVFQFAWFRIQDLWNHMKSTATVQVGGAPAKFLQVFPFMNGLSGFVNRHKKKGRGGGRAAAPERTPTKPPPPTQAPPPASPAAGVGGGGRTRPLQSQPLQGEFDEGMAWQPSTKDRFGFDEMVQQNARLRRGDAMRPYDGIIPQQQQVMQQKQLAQQAGQQQVGGRRGKAKQQPGSVPPQAVAEVAVATGGPDDLQSYQPPAILMHEVSSETLSARQLGSRNSLNAKRGQRSRRGKARPERGGAAPAATGAVAPVRGAAAAPPQWTPPQLNLPEITWQGMPENPPGDAAPATDATPHTPPVARRAPGKPAVAAAVSSLSGLLGSARAWAQFQVDRRAVEGVLALGLAPLEAVPP